jgi:hypothetical protein
MSEDWFARTKALKNAPGMMSPCKRLVSIGRVSVPGELLLHVLSAQSPLQQEPVRVGPGGKLQDAISILLHAYSRTAHESMTGR